MIVNRVRYSENFGAHWRSTVVLFVSTGKLCQELQSSVYGQIVRWLWLSGPTCMIKVFHHLNDS